VEVGWKALVEKTCVTPGPQAIFPPFRLDLESEQLFRGAERVRLRPKTSAVLRHLLGHAGHLVTRAELVTAVWHDAHGSEALPKGSIRELREAFGDDVAAPRFVESVGRRGYRFVAAVTFTDGAEPPMAAGLRRPLRVGREPELAWLRRALARARSGERQVVFVTGEPGIGKTTLVEAFLQQVGDAGIARGQCVEQYGAGEAYLPVLDALAHLCREPGGDAVKALLDRHAPTWLVQIPALVGAAELEALQRRIQGASRERMLREITDALDAAAAERPLVLVLEDLHWSDRSTVDLIAALARRRDPSRILVLGTHRPTDLIVGRHPLRTVQRELAARGQCEELTLGLLTSVEVTRYLDARFLTHDFPPDLGRAVHHGTDGNPLFMVNVVDDLVARRSIVDVSGRWRLDVAVDEVARGVPEGLRQLIENHIERLAAEERAVLEVASVAGSGFHAAAVAPAATLEPASVEACCNELVRRGAFLRAAEPILLPGRPPAACYEFLHAIYPTVFYDRLPVARRAHLHRQIGETEEALRGDRAGEIAAQLAVHFERAHDHARAVRHLRRAAESALRRHALHEGVAHLRRALGLLRALPETSARAAEELPVQVALGGALMATEGYGSAAVERAYARARALGGRLSDAPELFPMFRGLHRFSLVRAEIGVSDRLATRCRRIAERSRQRALRVEAHLARAESACYLGALRRAAAALERARGLGDVGGVASDEIGALPWDPRVGRRYHEALVLWLRGRPDEAARRMEEARTLGDASAHPFVVTYALCGSAFLHMLRREPDATERWAEAGFRSATEHGFKTLAALGPIFRGWVLAVRGRADAGVEEMRRGYAALQATGSALLSPYWLALMAEASARRGHAADGLALLATAQAAVEQSEERWCQAELHRIEGELLLGPDPGRPTTAARRRAEGRFRAALAIARRQGAASFEVRAATSLARLWRGSARAATARALLRRAYGRLGDGLATPDARDAGALLDEMRRPAMMSGAARAHRIT
jgi:DNA-binding winged helix-turn-helix (wHTH) protein/predicted ATPase